MGIDPVSLAAIAATIKASVAVAAEAAVVSVQAGASTLASGAQAVGTQAAGVTSKAAGGIAQAAGKAAELAGKAAITPEQAIEKLVDDVISKMSAVVSDEQRATMREALVRVAANDPVLGAQLSRIQD